MWSKTIKSRFTKVAIAISLAWLAISMIDNGKEKEIPAELLNLTGTPDSVKNVECKSWGFTDVLSACYLEITQDEFPLLLKGYVYEEIQQSTNSHEIGTPKLGQKFEITKQFLAQPNEFKHGGFVRVFTDSKMQKVIINLYIE